MARYECGFSRLFKDGGGPGVGPLAPVDPWVGEDVHVDIPGGDRRNRRRQGIAVAPSVHKAVDCPDGEHTHDRFDYCHPEKRKHRGGAKAEGPKRPYPPYRTVNRQAKEAFREWYYARRDRAPQEDVDKLLAKYDELKDLAKAARGWEESPEGKEWVNREKVKRAKGQGLKSSEHYEAKAAELQEKLNQLEKEYDRLYEKYALGPTLKERQAYAKPLNENVKQQNVVRGGIRRAKSMAALGFTRDWTDIIQRIAGGTKPEISAIRTGSRAFAHYSLDNGIIGMSDQALHRLGKIRDDPELLFSKGTDRDREVYAFAVSAVFHEFLHSVNPAHGAYVKDGITGMIEEGLTEAIANRMVARPDVLSSLLGTKVEEGIISKPGATYAIYVQTMEYLAERAAQKNNTDPEWFLGKWKFHTEPKTRGETILTDSGATEGRWRGIIQEAKDKLPGMKEARQAARMNKSFRWAVQQVLDNAWGALGFIFKVAGGAGSYEPYPPSTPAPTGGGGGSVGGGSRGGSLVPSNVDVRHTGSPPKGVRWQKFPRQGGEAVGGAGAGAVEAMEKGRTYLKPDQQAPEGTQEETGPRGGRYYESESVIPVYHGTTPEDALAIEKVGFMDKPVRWPASNTNLGFFFTESRDEAYEFATMYGAEVGDIIEANVKLRKPFTADSWAELSDLVAIKEMDIRREKFEDENAYGRALDRAGRQVTGEMTKQFLRRRGYDGVIFNLYRRRWIVAFESDRINVTGIAKSIGMRLYLVYPAGLEQGGGVKAALDEPSVECYT